jgi:hypothetical protein
VPGEGDDGFDSFIANYEYNEQGDPIDIAISVNSERSFADLEYFYDEEGRVSFRSQITFGTAEEPNFLAELFQYNKQGDLVFYTSTLNGVLREQTFEYDYTQECKVIQTTTVDPSQFGVNFDLKKLIYDEDDTLFRKELGLAPVLRGSDEGVESTTVYEYDEQGTLIKELIDVGNDGKYEFQYDRSSITEEEFANLTLPEDYNLLL